MLCPTATRLPSLPPTERRAYLSSQTTSFGSVSPNSVYYPKCFWAGYGFSFFFFFFPIFPPLKEVLALSLKGESSLFTLQINSLPLPPSCPTTTVEFKVESHRPREVKGQLNGAVKFLRILDAEGVYSQNRGDDAAESAGSRGDHCLKMLQTDAKEGPAVGGAGLPAGQGPVAVHEFVQLQLEDARARHPLHKGETHKIAKSDLTPALPCKLASFTHFTFHEP